jgi:hypothetical protein
LKWARAFCRRTPQHNIVLLPHLASFVPSNPHPFFAPFLPLQVLQGIDIELGEGNFAACGVYHRAAQGSSVQDVTIHASDAHAGIAGGAGSGGSHIGVTVIGGRYGVNYAEAQPVSTIAGFTLVNQTCAGVLYCGGMAATIVGTSIISHVGLNGYVAVLAGACTANETTPWLPGHPSAACVPRMLHSTEYDESVSGQVRMHACSSDAPS